MPRHPTETFRTPAPRKIVLDFDKLRALGVLTPEDGRSTMAEEFRIIKRPLLMNALGQGLETVENANLIMVTSALPKEGKTFTAINLAMSLANEVDNSVLLVDGDVAKPSVSRILGFKAQHGLIDFLLGEVNDIDDLILDTNIPKLRILPSGRHYQHATELLASESMRMLLRHLVEESDDRIVVFDSPPLLVTTEARELARNMGQIVMVVEADKTPHFAAKDALEQLPNLSIVGLVLNKSRMHRTGDYYSYGGYYGSYYGYSKYGYGESNNRRKSSFLRRLFGL